MGSPTWSWGPSTAPTWWRAPASERRTSAVAQSVSTSESASSDSRFGGALEAQPELLEGRRQIRDGPREDERHPPREVLAAIDDRSVALGCESERPLALEHEERHRPGPDHRFRLVHRHDLRGKRARAQL